MTDPTQTNPTQRYPNHNPQSTQETAGGRLPDPTAAAPRSWNQRAQQGVVLKIPDRRVHSSFANPIPTE